MIKSVLLATVLLGFAADYSFSQALTSPPAAVSASPSPTPEEASHKSASSKSAAAVKSDGTMGEVRLPLEKAQPVKMPRFERPPVIDGKLDDQVWSQAATFKDFYQWRPSDTSPASARTEAFAGYDTKYIYFAFHAYDDPAKVRATVPKRDAIFDDDSVAILLDTFNDKRRAYELIFSPLGIQADAILQEGQNDDFSFDIVMESKGVLTDDGYTVEIAIPFKSLRYEAGKGKLWGIHLLRQIKHVNGEQDSWMPISQNESGILNQQGYITGLEGISTEKTLELIPSLTVSETGKRTQHLVPGLQAGTFVPTDRGRFVNQPIALDLGLTAKYTLTPTVTLDAAINPDFAQVEADQTVLVANQRFPIFFEEKRPFFLEGIDYFRTPFLAVHPRAIVDPDLAVKLTGKKGRNTFGVLLASDNAPGNISEDDLADDPTLLRFLDKNAYIGVFRVKRDIGRENSLGLLATTYNFIEKHNNLAGLDGRFRLDKQTFISFQVLGTSTRAFFYDPDQDRDVYRTGNSFAYTFAYNSESKHWDRSFDITGRTRDYRAEVGFTRRTNTNNWNTFVRYKSEPKPKAKLINWRLFNFFGGNFDFQGRMQYWDNETQVQFNLQRESFFGFGIERGYERLVESEFGANRITSDLAVQRNRAALGAFAGLDNERSTQTRTVYVFGGSTPSKKYNFFLLGVYNWGVFDFDFGAGDKFPRVSPPGLLDPDAPLDPGPGNRTHFEGNVTYQPTAAWRNTLAITKDRLVRHDTGLVAYDDNIIALRSTYQFTRFVSARARIDYDTLASNIRGQFLLGWTPNPGTAFYIGYNDDLSRNGFSPFTGRLEPGFRRNGRTFFIKLSYLIRKNLGG
ncbi:MAG TPA: DUF5916 domain-containing protein [Pyrinomonadaceae bacterium]|nr:DUF5916 domain-containing protein [Pyrinomonadaceae bacterium]